MNRFAQSNLQLFASHEGSEHQHIFHDKYLEFVGITDGLVQRFLAQEGITEDEFGNMCQNELNAENLQPGGVGSPNAQSTKKPY